MKGIVNIGNSCYLNAVIQLLFNSPDFCKMVEKSGNELIINNIKNYFTNNNLSFNPMEIKALLDQRTILFKGNDQCDSSEVIIFLFDILNINNKKNYFTIDTTINIKCKLNDCLHQNEHVEKDLILFLPITTDLDSSYREYKMYEKLESSYRCDNCNNNTISRKKIVTSNWPNNLIIVLKRFDINMRKNNNMVEVPLLWRHDYKLVGGIIHGGNMNGGHYIYYGYENNNWYIANDSNIIKVNNITQYVNNSYILYYRK